MAFQILSLSGGGYKGLFAVDILRRLEKEAGRPIGGLFDLIAGTSIGGIVAIGLAMGKSASEIHDVFMDRGERIFPHGEPGKSALSRLRTRYSNWRGPKYDGVELRRVVEEVVGAQTLLGSARSRVLVPSVNLTRGKFQVFKTAHCPQFKVDKHLKAADIAMATSAAPLYFPMAKIGESYYADGGLVANAPDMLAVHEATHFLGRNIEDVRVLSIGTTTSKFSLPSSLGGDFGIRDWIAKDRLVSTVFSSQQQMVEGIVGHRLGERYVRMDEIPSAEQSVDLGLDIASASRRGTLIGIAEGVYQRFAGTPIIEQMLSHEPEVATFY